jgi:hypothetical protein
MHLDRQKPKPGFGANLHICQAPWDSYPAPGGVRFPAPPPFFCRRLADFQRGWEPTLSSPLSALTDVLRGGAAPTELAILLCGVSRVCRKPRVAPASLYGTAGWFTL